MKIKKSFLLCMLGCLMHQAYAQVAGTPYIMSNTPPVPAFTISSCTAPGSTIGWLTTPLPANSVDIAAKQRISVIVTSPGPYNFTTSAVNGVTFTAAGTFSAPGTYSIDLIASGTPTNYTVNNSTFNHTVSNTTPTNAGTCGFSRKVYLADQGYNNNNAGAGNHRFIYKVITGPSGREWLQTNLGSMYNKVGHPDFNPEMYAQSIDDYKAFGSLFQLGRASDSHELTNWTSATTAGSFPMGTTTNVIINPTANANGLFIIDGSLPGNYGDLAKMLDRDMALYVVGPFQPCPEGFKIAHAKASPSVGDYYSGEGISYNGGAANAFSNPLKLVAPTVYRSGVNGLLTSMPYRLMRGHAVATYPALSNDSPQHVISGGSLVDTSNNITTDRRYYLSSAADKRGPRDGYPVRCAKY